ncbi:MULTISPECIES: hypothetical protein [unclassified Microcoleus]
MKAQPVILTRIHGLIEESGKYFYLLQLLQFFKCYQSGESDRT